MYMYMYQVGFTNEFTRLRVLDRTAPPPSALQNVLYILLATCIYILYSGSRGAYTCTCNSRMKPVAVSQNLFSQISLIIVHPVYRKSIFRRCKFREVILFREIYTPQNPPAI